MTHSHDRVRALNGKERLWVIRASATSFEREVFRRVLWRRLKLWIKIVGSGATAALAFVNWGADMAENFGRLLHMLGLR